MNSTTQSFLGRYRLVKVLGQGAMGVVYEAADTRLNRTVAIKTVLRSHLADETTANEYASRFEREAQAAARLSHPHVVTVYDFGEHEDISYIVMEFIRGRELNQAFEAGEKFPLPEAIRMMRELLLALDYAHQQGIVHRDIKPANVMLDAAGRVKLTDFGVARVANANQDRTMPGTLVGTPSYMSPEQILGLAVGSRADIFAAGVILYQFLTGKRPFTGGGPFGVQRKIVQDDPEAPSHANPEVPKGFDLIIARALAKQPEDRYETAAAFAADLERIGATLPRDLPLIDLDLPDEAPSPPTPTPAAAARSAPAEAATRARAPAQPAAAPPRADPGLTLRTELPIGSPAAAPGPAPDPHDQTFDPEATVIMFRPSAPEPTARQPPATTPAPASPATWPAPASPAPWPAPASPTAWPATPPRSAAAPTPVAAPSPRPPPPTPAPVRPSTAAQAAGRAASAPRSAAPMPRPDSHRRTLLPLAAGAGVAVLALTTWLLVARPWAAKPSPAGQTPPAALTQQPTSTAPPAAPIAAPAPAPAPAPVPELRPAPVSAQTTASAPAAAVTATGDPGTAAPRPTTPARPAATRTPGTAPAPVRRQADDTSERSPAPPKAEPRSSGLEPRCSDLLQRMQLGEPLTPDQTAFFQTRCTR